MVLMSVRNIVEIASESLQRDLAWSLQPLFFTLRIFGIDFDVNPTRSINRRWVFLMLGILVLFVISYNSIKLVIMFHNEFSHLPSTDSAYILLYFTSLAVSGLLFVTSMLTVIQVQWQSLWAELQKVEQTNRLAARVYEKLRNAVIVALIVVILLAFGETLGVIVLTSSLSEDEYHRSLNNTRNASYFRLNMIMKAAIDIYKDTALLMFGFLIWFASESIQVIIKDIETCSSSIGNTFNYRLATWKRNYFVILGLIEEIDRFFGPALLVNIASLFLSTTFFSFRIIYVIFRGLDERQYASILKLTRNLLTIFGIIFITERLKNKASTLARNLAKRKNHDETIESKVDSLIIKINQNIPRISPMGMFEVSPRLFPALIGATITYVLVIAQFAASY